VLDNHLFSCLLFIFDTIVSILLANLPIGFVSAEQQIT
jgi:hypothetical protein